MLPPMFGMGGTEILVILIVALLFLGPDKLPQAAKTISKGIRDIKKQSRVLQRTIEDDEHIGGAIRDLRSALRGEDEPYRPPQPRKELEANTSEPAAEVTAPEAAAAPPDLPAAADPDAVASDPSGEAATTGMLGERPPSSKLTLPPTVGEPDDDAPAPSPAAEAELAALVKPAPNTIAHTPRTGEPKSSERKHG